MANPAPQLQTANIAKMLPIITGIVVVAYLVAAYALLFIPKLGRMVTGGDLDLTPFNDRVTETTSYSQQLQDAVKRYEKVNPDRRERVTTMVPLDPRIPDLYVLIDTIATRQNLALLSVDASSDDKATSAAGRKVVKLSINVAGGNYEQFKLFLAELERSERILDVQSAIFTPQTGSYGLTLRAYSLDTVRVLTPELAPPLPGTVPTDAAAAATAPTP